MKWVSMTDSAELDRLKTLSYNLSVSEKAGIFYVHVHELSIVVSDSDLQRAYDKLRDEKMQFFLRMVEMGIADQVPLPDSARRRNGFVVDLVDFGLKLVIIGVVALGLLLASLPFLDAFVVKRLGDGPRSAAMSLHGQIDRAFDRLVSLAPEEKDELLQVLRVRIIELRPFYKELQGLWADTPDSAKASQ
jgi:hypothetical protein